MRIFGKIGESINNTPGWHVSVEVMRLPVPHDLKDIGWHADDYDRLSVAYGLSLAGHDETTLGRIVRSIEVPDVGVRRSVEREDRFISKEQV